jgi:Tripartite tricarboxylate transporter TctB family
MRSENRVRAWLAGSLNRDVPTVIFLLVGASFAYGATAYQSGGQFFPLAIGTIIVLMCIAELIWHPAGAFDDEPESDEAETGGTRADVRRDAIAIGWLTASIAICYLFGMIVGIAVGTSLYFWMIARKNLSTAVLVGVVLTFCIWLGMVELAGFRLNPGILW